MANGVVSMFKLEMRLALCDALVDGASLDVARQLLLDLGLPEADLPSDKSLRTYQEGEEYQRHYDDRVQAYRLANWQPLAPNPNWQPQQAYGDLLMRGLCHDLAHGRVSATEKLRLLQTTVRQETLDYRRERDAATQKAADQRRADEQALRAAENERERQAADQRGRPTPMEVDMMTREQRQAYLEFRDKDIVRLQAEYAHVDYEQAIGVLIYGRPLPRTARRRTREEIQASWGPSHVPDDLRLPEDYLPDAEIAWIRATAAAAAAEARAAEEPEADSPDSAGKCPIVPDSAESCPMTPNPAPSDSPTPLSEAELKRVIGSTLSHSDDFLRRGA